MESRSYTTLNDTSWLLLFDATVVDRKTIYSENGLITILESDVEITDFSGVIENRCNRIGGIISAYSTSSGKYVYVKAFAAPSELFTLPMGQVDPKKDLSAVTDGLDELIVDLSEHEADDTDPHDVSKGQVDLGNLPNVLANVFGEEPAGALATDVLVYLLKDIVTAHTNRTNNPHGTTKLHLAIDKVMNYATATTAEDILDPDKTDLYATIAACHAIINSREQTVPFAKAGHVFGGDVEVLSAADKLLFDPMSTTVLIDGTDLVVKKGLLVTYVNDGIIRISRPLATDIAYPHSSVSSDVNPKPGWHYLYTDINTAGLIYQVGSSYIRPSYGISPYGEGDWVNISNGYIYNADGNPIMRTYIAKVYVDVAGHVTDVVNVPMGKIVFMKTPSLISPNTTYIFDNPFYEPVMVFPEIKLGDQWADPKWAEQAGVISTWSKHTPDIITVQTGALGLGAPAATSGNAFTSDNLSTTYTGSAALRLIIKRL